MISPDLMTTRPLATVLLALLSAPRASGLVVARPPIVRSRCPFIACNLREVDDTWTTTPSGLRYIDDVVGTGAAVKSGTVVKVDYTGRLESNGKQFDSSKGRGPLAFAVGTGKVIPGWDEGIASMRIGGKRVLSIPASLAYGESGVGDIPPNASLQFECELVGAEEGVGAVIATFPGGLPNVILVSLLALSFVPYLLPEGMRPSQWMVGGGTG